MSFAPVIMFVYNRADHFETTFAALSKCPECCETDLFIFADGAKNEEGRAKVEECRNAVKNADYSGFRSVKITESEKNRGLAASIIDGVTKVINQYGFAIVVEDDCQPSPFFLSFMNNSLDVFKTDRRIGAIAGYAPPIEFPEYYKADVFTAYRSCSWGWATWADRWQNVDWELKDFGDFCRSRSLRKKLNSNGADRFLRLYRQVGGGTSWSVRFGAHLVKNDMLTVYPRYSYISNIGCDSTGVHSTAEDAESMAVDLGKAIADPKIEFIAPDSEIMKTMKKHYSGGFVSDIKRAAGTELAAIKYRLKG